MGRHEGCGHGGGGELSGGSRGPPCRQETDGVGCGPPGSLHGTGACKPDLVLYTSDTEFPALRCETSHLVPALAMHFTIVFGAFVACDTPPRPSLFATSAQVDAKLPENSLHRVTGPWCLQEHIPQNVCSRVVLSTAFLTSWPCCRGQSWSLGANAGLGAALSLREDCLRAWVKSLQYFSTRLRSCEAPLQKPSRNAEGCWLGSRCVDLSLCDQEVVAHGVNCGSSGSGLR